MTPPSLPAGCAAPLYKGTEPAKIMQPPQNHRTAEMCHHSQVYHSPSRSQQRGTKGECCGTSWAFVPSPLGCSWAQGHNSPKRPCQFGLCPDGFVSYKQAPPCSVNQPPNHPHIMLSITPRHPRLTNSASPSVLRLHLSHLLSPENNIKANCFRNQIVYRGNDHQMCTTPSPGKQPYTTTGRRWDNLHAWEFGRTCNSWTLQPVLFPAPVHLDLPLKDDLGQEWKSKILS